MVRDLVGWTFQVHQSISLASSGLSSLTCLPTPILYSSSTLKFSIELSLDQLNIYVQIESQHQPLRNPAIVVPLFSPLQNLSPSQSPPCQHLITWHTINEIVLISVCTFTRSRTGQSSLLFRRLSCPVSPIAT